MHSYIPNRKFGLFKQYIEHTSGNLLLINNDGEILATSPPSQVLFGELTGKNFNLIFPGIDLDSAGKEHIIINNKRYVITLIAHKEEEIVLAELVATSLSQQALSITPVSREPYLYNYKMIQALVSGLPAVIFRFRQPPRGGYEFISDQINTLTGYQRKDFAPYGKMKLHDLASVQDQREIANKMNKAAQSLTPYTIQYKITTRNHEQKWLHESSHFVRENDVVYCEGVITDITADLQQTSASLKGALESEDLTNYEVAHAMQEGVQQQLTAALYAFEAVKNQMPSDNQVFKSGLDALRNGIDQARTASTRIAPKTLSDFGIIDTLTELAESLTRQSGVSIEFNTNCQQLNLPYFQATSLYKICKEALDNSLKHANASAICVQLYKKGSCILLSIEDDGNGFEEDNVPHGQGLGMMRARAQALNSSLLLDSKTKRGTSVALEITI
ncbi:sensor histidine kinase [Marinoscillum furvescens]|uniref:histidine kinase n=1 Tax=Marinoscillum furvescens DSM 4134 TaxID=1122208 RepID=A0A3D9L2X3_MARFU|nr:ATP-binding protein [Marinoscillum furvescens]RED97001.1 PAS domain-containing protein [Marinoscillum furvescens DSM 4134]